MALTASYRQAAAYLLGVSLFSIAFLVFLNATISFVVTDILDTHHGVGTIVGNLSFADEMLALIACPLWGIASDRIGVRLVSLLGFVIVAVSLFCVPHARQVYPDLLLVRLLFSIAAAACTTMVTAILPLMTLPRASEEEADVDAFQGIDTATNRHSVTLSVNSELTITPARYESPPNESEPLLADEQTSDGNDMVSLSGSNQLAGIVGMCTGIGALLAVGVLLPLPALLGDHQAKSDALTQTFYIVGTLAALVGIAVYYGLRHLPGEKSGGYLGTHDADNTKPQLSLVDSCKSALRLISSDADIALACIGGFVARSSSVLISLFIPLFVNAYFVDHGLCNDRPDELMKEQCKRAYRLASMLTGISQLVALLSAPAFGFISAYFANRKRASSLPLMAAAVSGIVGCIAFGLLHDPDPRGKGHFAIPAVILIGVSQIGAIVCSLGLLSRGLQNKSSSILASNHAGDDSEGTREGSKEMNRIQLKGTIAGLYSLCGGLGIILLSKIGGMLFDDVTQGAPFFMMAGFNILLLLAAAAVSVRHGFTKG